MSSAPNKSHRSSKSASSSEPKTDAQTDSALQSPSPSPAENSMDQPLESTLTAIPPAPPTPSETMSSTDSSSPDPTPTPPTPIAPAAAVAPTPVAPTASEPDSLDRQAIALRQQPIPPASEPMQYRAIGLVRGKYVASDEQFTRGSIFTDDGFEIGAVLLGRVMSLVKKHVDLEQPHLWVVYPRTREKGDGDLHVQIVGVWEPENLNRMLEPSEQDSIDAEHEEIEQELDEAELEESASDEPTLNEVEEPVAAEQEPTDAELEESAVEEVAEEVAEQVSSSAEAPQKEAPIVAEDRTGAEETETEQAEGQTEESGPPPIPAAELDDKYFSVRGEVIYQSAEEQQILVKIRRAPRPGTDESKAFKVVLKGTLEGKAVGYFWDLHVQREGNMLVVQEGTMIGAVPPQKRKKPPFNKRGGGGGRRGGGRPPQGGGPRKPWTNRDSQARPSRGDRSERPSPPQNREYRAPSPRPVKRRNPEKPEG